VIRFDGLPWILTDSVELMTPFSFNFMERIGMYF
jgi:hypothetical protein